MLYFVTSLCRNHTLRCRVSQHVFLWIISNSISYIDWVWCICFDAFVCQIDSHNCHFSPQSVASWVGCAEGLGGGGLGGQELALASWVEDWGQDFLEARHWSGLVWSGLVWSGTAGLFGSRQEEWKLCIGTWINELYLLYCIWLLLSCQTLISIVFILTQLFSNASWWCICFPLFCIAVCVLLLLTSCLPCKAACSSAQAAP